MYKHITWTCVSQKQECISSCISVFIRLTHFFWCHITHHKCSEVREENKYHLMRSGWWKNNYVQQERDCGCFHITNMFTYTPLLYNVCCVSLKTFEGESYVPQQHSSQCYCILKQKLLFQVCPHAFLPPPLLMYCFFTLTTNGRQATFRLRNQFQYSTYSDSNF